jgi:lipopolysaccharide transport system permease protein
VPVDPVTHIRPPHRWLRLELRELLRFRELAYRLARRDLTLRYRQTFLGVAWVFLQPLIAAGAFTLIFGRVAGIESPEGIPYFVLAYWGATAFNAFGTALVKSSNSLVGNASLVSKVYFPRLLLPVSTVGTTVLDSTVASGLGLVVTIASGVRPGWQLVTLPLWLFSLQVLGLAIGLLFAPLVVKYRDVGYILPVLSQTLMFLSPVGYSLARVPRDLRFEYLLNPLASLVEGARWAAIDVDAPPAAAVVYALGLACTVLVVGAYLFRRQERLFADVI